MQKMWKREKVKDEKVEIPFLIFEHWFLIY